MDTPLSRLIRSHLRDIEPYEPVDPPELLAQRAGVAVDQIIKLNGNENPYGASPRVVKALQEYQTFHFPFINSSTAYWDAFLEKNIWWL